MTQHLVEAVFRLDDDVAVVTGALGRLGPVWIEALIHAGAKVAALDLPTSEPSAAFEALVARVDSTQLFKVDCDITDRSTVEAALKKVTSQLGCPTVLVNNAGLDQPPDKPALHAYWPSFHVACLYAVSSSGATIGFLNGA